MKFFKNILMTVIVCITVNSDAKITRPAAPVAAPAPAIQKPIVQQQPRPIIPAQQPPQQQKAVVQPQPKPVAQMQHKPFAQTPTFYNLMTYIKNTPNTWDTTNGRLNPGFVTEMVKQARIGKLDGPQLETLLQTARDMHGVFSGNQQKDMAILQSVGNQIGDAARQI